MKTVSKEVTCVSFEQVVKVMTFTNVCSYLQAEYDAWIAENGLNQRPHLAMATHSVGTRRWRLDPRVEEKEVPFFEEPSFNGGWFHFEDNQVAWLKSQSATSGSMLVAEKEGPDNWTLTLTVPIMENGEPYKGAYWTTFHEVMNEALAGSDESEKYSDFEEEMSMSSSRRYRARR